MKLYNYIFYKLRKVFTWGKMTDVWWYKTVCRPQDFNIIKSSSYSCCTIFFQACYITLRYCKKSSKKSSYDRIRMEESWCSTVSRLDPLHGPFSRYMIYRDIRLLCNHGCHLISWLSFFRCSYKNIGMQIV